MHPHSTIHVELSNALQEVYFFKHNSSILKLLKSASEFHEFRTKHFVTKHQCHFLPPQTKHPIKICQPGQNIPCHFCQPEQNIPCHFCHHGQNMHAISATPNKKIPLFVIPENGLCHLDLYFLHGILHADPLSILCMQCFITLRK